MYQDQHQQCCFLLGFPVIFSSKNKIHYCKNQQSSNSQLHQFLHDLGISVLDSQVPQMIKWAPEYLGLGWEIDISSFSPSLYISIDKGQGISKFLGLIDNLTSD